MSEIISGTDAIRQAVANYARRGHLAPLARDVGTGTAALDSFGRGEGSLTPITLSALARELLDADYDPETDLLKARPGPEPRSLGVRPEPFAGPQRLYPIGESPRGPQLVDAPRQQQRHRPGFANK